MTVVIETIKTDGMQIKGDIKNIKNVSKIIDGEKEYTLWHSEYWQTIVSKRMFKIIAIGY